MKLTRTVLHYCTIFLLALTICSCSDLREPAPTVSKSFHDSGWLDANSQNFHGVFIRNSQWDLKQCQECHGIDYAGGIANNSCLTCHPATPEDCIVCHGGTDNLSGAPPEDLDGNISTGAVGVGGHTVHLGGSSLSNGFECATCHVVPSSFDSPGHADSELPAEVLFSNLALVDDAVPRWERNIVSCTNSYCHGNWSLSKNESNNGFIYSADFMDGNNASPNWTDPETAACGTCHGLPPTGHNPFELNACTGCHGSVIDAGGNIIDRSKHVNGQINVFGQEFPMF